jgi:hypothetical protein
MVDGAGVMSTDGVVSTEGDVRRLADGAEPGDGVDLARRAAATHPPRLREGLGATSDRSGRVLAASGAAGLTPRAAGARWVDELRDVLVPAHPQGRLELRARIGRELDVAGNLAAGLAVAAALGRAVGVAAGEPADGVRPVLARVRALHPAVERNLRAVVWTGSVANARAVAVAIAAGLGTGLELDRAAALGATQVLAAALREELGDDADLAAYPDAITVSPRRLGTPRQRALAGEFESARTALRAVDGIRARLRELTAVLDTEPVRGAERRLVRALSAALATALLGTLGRLRGLADGLRLAQQLTADADFDRTAALAEALADIRTTLSDMTTADLSGMDLRGESLHGLRWSSRTTWPRDMWQQVRAASVEVEPDRYEIRDGAGQVD